MSSAGKIGVMSLVILILLLNQTTLMVQTTLIVQTQLKMKLYASMSPAALLSLKFKVLKH